MKLFVSVYCLKEIGGISTAAYNLLYEIADKYDVTLCVLSDYIGENFVIPKSIKLIKGSSKLGMATISRSMLDCQSVSKKSLRNYYRIVRRLQKEKFIYRCLDSIIIDEEFDAAIAFSDLKFITANGYEYYDYYFVLNRIKAKRKIAWVHNNPKYLGYKHDDTLKRFERFDGIVNVSFDCKGIFDNIVPEYTFKSFVVYNMYNIDGIKQKSREYDVQRDNNMLRFVTVARVSNRQKRIDRIVSVCKKLDDDGYNNFEWIIVGDGPDRLELEETVKNEHLESLVKFVGLKHNPYPYMLTADAFVLTSLYEGLPMTVREAQILDCPTLTTSFGAASEAIDEFKNGEICENSEEGVYKMIRSILDNPEKLTGYRDYLIKNSFTNEKSLLQLKNILTGC